ELEAHTGMFSGKTNDGYYDLGLQTAQFIREAVNRAMVLNPLSLVPRSTRRFLHLPAV
ncbi:hypothetical protein B0H11DRAFT_1705817, partial [Mycena galericulata]